MKEIVTSWIILITVIILFTVNSFVVKNVSEEICNNINMAKDAIEKQDYKQAEKVIAKIKKSWDTESKKIVHIFPQSQLEEVGRVILMAHQHIAEKDVNDAVLRLKEIEYLVKNLEEHEKITLDNIF